MATVLLLGAASDMAAALANEYARHGYAIQLAARNAGRLEALKSDLEVRYQAAVTLHEFDALDFAGHPAFVDQLPLKPDVSICIFGYLGDNETALSRWPEAHRIIDTNYTGAVSVLNAITALYRSQKNGTIVGISSVAGERGRQSNFIYGSAKAGFTAYLSGLRNLLFREGIHVMSVQPGFVYTSMTEGLKLPPLLTATPEQVARAVYRGAARKKNTIYVKWFWRWIMFIIRNIPEFQFKKMKL